MNKRPNILFLMSDQHRADVAGFAGNEVIRTPVLDRLAQTGVVFRNAYTPSPICVPARQCLMAGQLPKTCGCEGWIDLQPNYLTFARVFAQHAYTTTCAGKLHHLTEDQMQGWTKRISPDADIMDRYIDGRILEEFDRYKPTPGTGKWSNQKEVEQSRIAEGTYHRFDRRAIEATLDEIDRYFIDAEYHRPQSHRPLLLKVSLLQPHYPFFTDEKKFKYYLNRVPIYTDTPCDHPVLSLSQQNRPVNVTERDIRCATAAYYGMVETVDTYYGQVFDALEYAGENLDDWIIIYTTDHGEMLGEHGIWEKTRFYEGSVKIPLIIRWPKGFDGGRVVDENVNLCDLFATLCDLAGLPIPPNLDSRSMAPLLRGEKANWNNETISQMNKDHVMIKRDHLKYQYYGEKFPEVLFDLEKDPTECANVAARPEYAQTMERFRKRLAELGHGPNGDSNYKSAGY